MVEVWLKCLEYWQLSVFYLGSIAGYYTAMKKYRLIINIAKEHSQNILRVHREDETSGAKDKTFILSDCSQGTCFRDLNSDVITNMCRTNNKNAKGFYRFFILW